MTTASRRPCSQPYNPRPCEVPRAAPPNPPAQQRPNAARRPATPMMLAMLFGLAAGAGMPMPANMRGPR